MVAERGSKRVRSIRRAAAPGIDSRALWLLLALGCFTQKPSSETGPSTAPEAPAPERPAEPPAQMLEQSTPPAAPQAEPAQRYEPAPSGKDTASRRRANGQASAGAAPPPAASAPLPEKKAAAKARGLAGPEGERDLSDSPVGSADEKSPSGQLRRRLDRAYRAGTPDCPSARDRKKAVCDLAAQICQLIDRDPNVASVAEYCSDAKERCAEAQRRTEERCPE
jgi:hypothetical protein